MLNLTITQSIMLRWQRRRQHQSWHKFPQISSALTQSSFKAYVTLNNIQASTIIGICQFLDMQTAATRFSYNLSYTNPNDLQEDIMESLWNFLQFIFNHLSMILKLLSQIYPFTETGPQLTESSHFWNPNLNRHNSQTIWPNTTKF